MNTQLKKVLEHIKLKNKHHAESGARNYLNVDIGKVAGELGFKDLEKKFSNREVVVNIKGPEPGIKVRIDGRTFINYVEYSDGFAVASHIAAQAGIPAKPYTAGDSMILNIC